MTVETKERHGWAKVAFYTFRTAVLGALTVMGVADASNLAEHALTYCLWGFLALFVFGLLTRRMPWDLIAGGDVA